MNGPAFVGPFCIWSGTFQARPRASLRRRIPCSTKPVEVLNGYEHCFRARALNATPVT